MFLGRGERGGGGGVLHSWRKRERVMRTENKVCTEAWEEFVTELEKIRDQEKKAIQSIELWSSEQKAVGLARIDELCEKHLASVSKQMAAAKRMFSHLDRMKKKLKAGEYGEETANKKCCVVC